MRTKKLWTKEEESILISKYGKMDAGDIFPDRTISSIYNKANKLNLNGIHQDYTCDNNFFSIPNILNSYYAGFIAADGCIYDKQRGQPIIQLTCNDKEIIYALHKDIKYTGIIELKSDLNPNHNTTYCIRVRSSKLANDLEKNWNITCNKSLTLQPPNITDLDLQLAYIKGYMDGDGGIYRYPSLTLFFCSGSYKMISWIKDILKSSNKISSRKNGNLFSIKIYGETAKIALHSFYSLDTPFITRKKKVFDGV